MRTKRYLLTGLIGLSLTVMGQTTGKTKSGKVKVSPALGNILDAGGPRFKTVGQERWSAAIEIKGAKGEALLANTNIVMEWPARLAIVTTSGKAVFDPVAGKRPVTDEFQSALAELLLEDSLDGFLAAHSGDGATRFEGLGYPDPDRKGQTVNIVTLSMPSRTKSAKPGVTKQYWFDRRTGLLVRVRHSGDQTETRLDGWQEIQGNMFPATMTMYEKGVAKYVLYLGVNAVGPPQSDSLFDGK